MLTPWAKELEMLEDWLNDPEPENDCQGTIMQIIGENHSAELLKNLSPGDEHEMTSMLKHVVEEEVE